MTHSMNQNTSDTCLNHIWWGVDPSNFINPAGLPGNGIISPGPIEKIPPGGPGTKGCTKKRAVTQNDMRLIRSDIWSHNATDLCTSDHSRGPDFVSLAEGMHCDMDTRKLTPLCHESGSYQNAQDKHSIEDCFSIDENKLIGRSGIQKRAAKKQYSELLEWRQNASE
jgi:hypothetical protein